MDVFATFDAIGLPTGFWPQDGDGPPPPEGAVPIGEAAWEEFTANAGLRRWDGKAVQVYAPPAQPAPSPPDISDRQFAQILALDGVITQDEALAWAARGDLPDALEDALTHVPTNENQRFAARMLLSAATMYQRGHPLVPVLGALLTNPATKRPYDAAALDSLWSRGAKL